MKTNLFFLFLLPAESNPTFLLKINKVSICLSKLYLLLHSKWNLNISSRKPDISSVSEHIMGIMGLWFLDFLLEHLSLFGKGTPQHQVPFGSTGRGVYSCLRVCVCTRAWMCVRWNSRCGGSDHTDRRGEWQTIPAVKFPHISPDLYSQI